MPLRPPDFEVDPDDPFKNDALGRERPIRTLAEIIASEEQAAVVSVSGGFGSGKTAYLRMLAAHLREEHGVDAMEFNAWQDSYTKDPLVDVASALAAGRDEVSERLLPIAAKLGGRLAWRVLTQLVKSATAGVIDVESVDLGTSDDGGGFEEWGDARKRVTEFKSVLEHIVKSAERNLVVIIDELDRCRPDYAIDMLNVARHLFDVPGVVIVLGVNRGELEHRVQEVFGVECNADVYLRRFVDLPVNLRAAGRQRLDAFADSVVRTVQQEGHETSDWLNAALQLLLASTDTSLRDVQQIARLVPRIAPGGGASVRGFSPVAILSMVVFRHINRDVYEDFASGRSDAFAAVSALRAGFATIGDTTASNAAHILDRMELVLLQVGDEQGHSALQQAGFAERYVEAGLGSAETAANLVGSGGGPHSGMIGRQLPIQALADRIDLVA